MSEKKWGFLFSLLFAAVLGFTAYKLKPKERHLNRMETLLRSNSNDFYEKEAVKHLRIGVKKEIFYPNRTRNIEMSANFSELLFKKEKKDYVLVEEFDNFCCREKKNKQPLLEMTKILSKRATYNFQSDLLKAEKAWFFNKKKNLLNAEFSGLQMKAEILEGNLRKGFQSLNAKEVSGLKMNDESQMNE